MRLYLSSSRPEVLAKAQAYLEKIPEAGVCKKEKSHGAGTAEYSVSLPEGATEALLNRLLTLSPDLDIAGTVISDQEGRGGSFWESRRYQSAADRDGRRYYEISSSTGWA